MVEQIFEALRKEYAVRRKMLIERAKVTLQSMLWSKEYLEVKGTLEQAQQAAQSGQDELLEDPELQLSQVFNARIGMHQPTHLKHTDITAQIAAAQSASISLENRVQ